MVTVNERPVGAEIDRPPKLLGARVEQNMTHILNEFGVRPNPASAAAAPARPTPAPGLAYGVPMPGVRYYAYLPED